MRASARMLYLGSTRFRRVFLGTWPALNSVQVFLNESENIRHAFVCVGDGNVVGVAG